MISRVDPLDPTDPNWKARLSYKKQPDGTMVPTQTRSNLYRIFEHDPNLADLIGRDSLKNQTTFLRPPSWRSSSDTTFWTEEDTEGVRVYLHERFGVRFPTATVNKVVLGMSLDHQVDPLVDFFDSVRGKWDGAPRLDSLLLDHLGAEDTEWLRPATRAFFVGAVERALRPGQKMDYSLLLYGQDDELLSAFIRELVPRPEWHTDSIRKLGSSHSAKQIQGIWIVEVKDLHKAFMTPGSRPFLTSQKDRVGTGRSRTDRPRTCVFICTTNDTKFISDILGERRFWPVHCTRLYEHSLDTDIVTQVWAEALEAYETGSKPYLAPEEHIESLIHAPREHLTTAVV